MSDEQQRQELEDADELLDLLDRQERGEEIDEERLYELDLRDRVRQGEELSDQEWEDFEFFERVRQQKKQNAAEYADLLNRKDAGEDVDEARLYYLELLDKKFNGEELSEDELDYVTKFEDEQLIVNDNNKLGENVDPNNGSSEFPEKILEREVTSLGYAEAGGNKIDEKTDDETTQSTNDNAVPNAQEEKPKAEVNTAESSERTNRSWGIRWWGSNDEDEQKEKEKHEAEAKLKAEAEEAKREAEEEAKRKVEEEAKLKAEEDAKRQAEEEAKLKAEEAAKKAEEENSTKAAETAKPAWGFWGRRRQQREDEAAKKKLEEMKRAEEAAAEAMRLIEEEAKQKAEEDAQDTEKEGAGATGEQAESPKSDESLMGIQQRQSFLERQSTEDSAETKKSLEELAQAEKEAAEAMRIMTEEARRKAEEDARVVEEEKVQFLADAAVSFEEEARIKAEDEKILKAQEKRPFWEDRKSEDDTVQSKLEEEKTRLKETDAAKQMAEEQARRKSEIEARLRENELNQSKLEDGALLGLNRKSTSPIAEEKKEVLEVESLINTDRVRTSRDDEDVTQMKPSEDSNKKEDSKARESIAKEDAWRQIEIENRLHEDEMNRSKFEEGAILDAMSAPRSLHKEEKKTIAENEMALSTEVVSAKRLKEDLEQINSDEIDNRVGELDSNAMKAMTEEEEWRQSEMLARVSEDENNRSKLDEGALSNVAKDPNLEENVLLREDSWDEVSVDIDESFEIQLFERKGRGGYLDDDELYALELFERRRDGEEIYDEELEDLERLNRQRRERQEDLLSLRERKNCGEKIDESLLYELELFERLEKGDDLDKDELYELSLFKRRRQGKTIPDEDMDELDYLKRRRRQKLIDEERLHEIQDRRRNGEDFDEDELYELELIERNRSGKALDQDEVFELDLFTRRREGEMLQADEVDKLDLLRQKRKECARVEKIAVTDDDLEYERELLHRQKKGQKLNEDESYFLELVARERDGAKLYKEELSELNQLKKRLHERERHHRVLAKELDDLLQLKSRGETIDEDRLYELGLFDRRRRGENLDYNETYELQLLEIVERGESLNAGELDELKRFKLRRHQLARDAEDLERLRDRKKRGKTVDEDVFYELELLERKQLGYALNENQLCELKLLDRVRNGESLPDNELEKLNSLKQKRPFRQLSNDGKKQDLEKASDEQGSEKKKKKKKKKMRRKKKKVESPMSELSNIQTQDQISPQLSTGASSNKESPSLTSASPIKESPVPTPTPEKEPRKRIFGGLFGRRNKKEIELEKEKQRQEELMKEQLKALGLQNELELIQREKEIQESLVKETIERKKQEELEQESEGSSSSWETDSDWDGEDSGSEEESEEDDEDDETTAADRATMADGTTTTPRNELFSKSLGTPVKLQFSPKEGEVIPGSSSGSLRKGGENTAPAAAEEKPEEISSLKHVLPHDRFDMEAASSEDSSMASSKVSDQSAGPEKPMDVAEVLAAARAGKLSARKSKATHLSKHLEAEKQKRQRRVNRHGDEISLGHLELKRAKPIHETRTEDAEVKQQKPQRPWGESKMRPLRLQESIIDEKKAFFEDNQHVFERSVFNFNSFDFDDSISISKLSQADTTNSDVRSTFESIHYGNEYEGIESKLTDKIKENEIEFDEIWEKTEMDRNVAAHIIQKREQRRREKAKVKAKAKNGEGGDFPRLILFEGEKYSKKRKKKKKKNKKNKKKEYTLSKEFRRAMKEVFEEEPEQAYEKTFGDVVKTLPTDFKAHESTFTFGDISVDEASKSGESEESDAFEDDYLKRLRARSMQQEVKQLLYERRNAPNVSSDRSTGSRSYASGRSRRRDARSDSGSRSRGSRGSRGSRRRATRRDSGSRSHASGGSRRREARDSASDIHSQGSRSRSRRHGKRYGRSKLDATEVYARAVENQKNRKVFKISELRQEMEEEMRKQNQQLMDPLLSQYESETSRQGADAFKKFSRMAKGQGRFQEPLPVPDMLDDDKKSAVIARNFAMKLFSKVKGESTSGSSRFLALTKERSIFKGLNSSDANSAFAQPLSDTVDLRSSEKVSSEKKTSATAKSFAMRLFTKIGQPVPEMESVATKEDHFQTGGTNENGALENNVPLQAGSGALVNRFAAKLFSKVKTSGENDGESVATREKPTLNLASLKSAGGAGNSTLADSDAVANNFATKLFSKINTSDENEVSSVATREKPSLNLAALKVAAGGAQSTSPGLHGLPSVSENNAVANKFAAKLFAKASFGEDNDGGSVVSKKKTSLAKEGSKTVVGVGKRLPQGSPGEPENAALSNNLAAKLFSKASSGDENDGGSVATREKPSLNMGALRVAARGGNSITSNTKDSVSVPGNPALTNRFTAKLLAAKARASAAKDFGTISSGDES